MIYITGADGQLGMELIGIFKNQQIPFRSFNRKEWDVTSESDGERNLHSGNCHVLINCAAYTAVDAAEKDIDHAYQINAKAPVILKKLLQKFGAFFVHLSTDFVFDGFPPGNRLRPWKPEDPTSPRGVYAESKRAGELGIVDENRSKNLPDFYGVSIIRTSWVYSSKGKNFPATILRLLNDPERKTLSVVEDQIGRPTWAYRLAEFVLLYIKKLDPENRNLHKNNKASETIGGVLHFSNEGISSWFDFAVAIQDLAVDLGMIQGKTKSILPIPSENYPVPAPRPSYSVLDLSEARMIMKEIPHWHEDLKKMLINIKNNRKRL